MIFTKRHTDTYIVSKHECSSLNDKLVRFFVFDNSRRQTCSCAGLATRVDSSRTELLHLPSTSTAPATTNYTMQCHVQIQKHNVIMDRDSVIILLAL